MAADCKQDCKNCSKCDVNNVKFAVNDEDYKLYYCNTLDKYVAGFMGQECYCFTPTNNPVNNAINKLRLKYGCFITTAVVDICKKPDDCELMMKIRDFRNNVLQKSEKYDELLKEYDYVGPQIAEKLLNASDYGYDRYAISSALLKMYLEPCKGYLDSKNYEDAIKTYKAMVDHCKTIFKIEYDPSLVEYDETVTNNEKGHGRARVNRINVNTRKN